MAMAVVAIVLPPAMMSIELLTINWQYQLKGQCIGTVYSSETVQVDYVKN